MEQWELGNHRTSLTMVCYVDFGENYKRPLFFVSEDIDRKGWVPGYPYTVTEFESARGLSAYSVHTRTMLPPKLAWAWTIWKAQGQTIRGKLVADLGADEKEHGLT